MATPRRLLLYTKPPIPGRVKTRLTPELTPQQAAELHAAFLGDLLERLAGGRFDLRIAWALQEGERREDLPDLSGEVPEAAEVPALLQTGRDLGERLYDGLDRAARRIRGGARAVAAFGSDHPTVPVETLHRAFERLEAGTDAVLGPSFDGGYYLMALRREVVLPELFRGIAWSTGRVLEQTLDRIAAAGLSHELVDEGLDVDTPEDLEHLVADLARSGPALCPRTHRLLDAWGRLPGLEPTTDLEAP